MIVTDIATALRRLAPAGVLTGSRLIDAADLTRLRPAESAAVGRAVERRRREFATGRVLLRELLDTDDVIPVRADRSPELPAGVVGSLAHDDVVAVAAVSRVGVAALGIDIERHGPADRELAAEVLRPDDAAVDARLAFVMKEASYKAWSGGGGHLLEFSDVRLSVDGDRFTGEVVATGDRLDGRWADVAGRWLALVTVPAR